MFLASLPLAWKCNMKMQHVYMLFFLETKLSFYRKTILLHWDLTLYSIFCSLYYHCWLYIFFLLALLRILQIHVSIYIYTIFKIKKSIKNLWFVKELKITFKSTNFLKVNNNYNFIEYVKNSNSGMVCQ